MRLFFRRSEQVTEPAGEPLLLVPFGPDEPDPDQPYLHGQYDGSLGIEDDAFAEFLQAATPQEHITRQLAELQEKLQQVEKAYISTQTIPKRLQTLEHALQEARQQYEQIRSLRDRCEQELAEVRQAPDAPSLVQIFMYGAAGIAFLLGDLIVSKEIVAQVLYLPEVYERWLFALGLSALTFVLKVAYDRLERRFEATILVISGAVLLTLILMGVLRSQEIQRQQMLRSNEMTTWSPEATELVERQEVSGPSNTVLMMAFILSTVMFAMAGAVCFSTAHAHARRYFHIYRPLRQKFRELDAQTQYFKERVNTLSEQLSAGHEELGQANALLAVHGTPETVRQELESLASQMQALKEKLAELQATQRLASYRSGRQRARQYQHLQSDQLQAEQDRDHAQTESDDALPEDMAASPEQGDAAAEGDGHLALDQAENDAAEGFPEQLQAISSGTTASEQESKAATQGAGNTERPSTPRSRRERGVRHGLRRPFLDVRDEILELTA